MLVVDTNVFFAAVRDGDITHKSATTFLFENTKELHAPELLKVELIALLIRSFDVAIAELYFKEITASISFHANVGTDILLEYIKHKKTRGCDSYFAYLADQLNVKLVSFDKDLIAKTRGLLLKP